MKYQQGDKKGFTNIGSGNISARNQIKNSSIEYKSHGWLIVNGENGSKSHFALNNQLVEGEPGRAYSLLKEQKANGNIFSYEYNSPGILKFIKAMDATSNVWYGWIKLIQQSKQELENTLNFEVQSNDGRKVQYKLKKFKKNKEQNIPSSYRIKEVIRPNAPYEKYEYSEKHGSYDVHMTKKRKPGGRFLGIEYYGNEKPFFRRDRVAKLFAPVGHDRAPIMTYEFGYDHIKNRMGQVDKGVTYVFDAKRHMTQYWHNKDLRIDYIEKFTGTKEYQIYSREKFIWSDEGNLTCHYIEDQNHVIQGARVFKYDRQGNVLQDSFYGNLQGGETKITLNEPSKTPKQEGCNSWSINYRYSQDGRNLLLEEIEPNGKSVQYTYHGDKDLIASKLTMEHGQIKIREFYDYDQFALANLYIIDDGTCHDKRDLSGVTERKITRTINQTEIPVGLPKQIDEYHLNPSNGGEILFKRIKNYYSIEGYLIHREIYDSLATLQYVEHFEYDAHGNCLSETNALQQTILKSYNKNDELILEKTSRCEKHYEHDYSGRIIAVKELHDDGSIFVTSNVYDHLNCLVATIDPFGQQTTNEYDDFGRLIKTTAPVYIDPLGNCHTTSISKNYDIFGNVTESIDQLGQKTSTRYNSRRQPICISYPGGASEIFEYHDDGTLKKSIGKNGLTTLYTHDCFGRLLKSELYSSSGILSTTSSTYNSFHKLTDTDANGHTTFYSYTFSGLLKSVSKHDALTEYEYDELQRPFRTKVWTNQTNYSIKTHQFDLLNQILEERVEDETGTLLRHVQFSYDFEGNQVEVIQHFCADVSITRTSYDSQGRPTKITDGEGHVTRISYNTQCFNQHGQRVIETISIDALGNQTYTMLNIFGKSETICKKNAYGQLIFKKQIGYEPTGNISFTLESVMTPDKPIREIMTKWAYNEQNCLISLTEATGTTEQKLTQHQYNPAGEKTKTIKPNGIEIHYFYNDLGLLKSFNASDNSFSYRYEYDRNGNLTKSIDSLNNQTTTRVYDDADRMVKEITGTGIEVSYAYDSIGRPVKVILPDTSFIEYDYNPLNITKVHRYSKSGNKIFTHEYARYDLGGHLIEEQNSIGNIRYRYNLNSQLTEMDSDFFSESMTYDAVKNLTSFEIKKTSQNVTGEFSYDDLYQLKSEKGVASHHYLHDSLNNCVKKDGNPQETNALNQLLKAYDQTFTYDANGNRVSNQTINYSYDALDRLTAVFSDTKKTFYGYDSFNRRLTKIEKDHAGKTIKETHYLYFGQNEVGSYDENGNLNEFRTLGTGKGAEIGATVGIEKGDYLYFPSHDHNGNIVSLIESKTLAVAESYRYTAFGDENIYDENNQKIETTKIGNPWRFSSKRVDQETGFINFGRRYYDSKTAKWISPDPIGFEGGPNLYAYVMNNPLTNSDLYGLECVRTRSGTLRSRNNRTVRTRGRSPSQKVSERIVNCVEELIKANQLQKIFYDDEYENGEIEQSRIIDMSGFNKIELPNCGVSFNNGIRVTVNEGVETALKISEMGGDIHVQFTYNQTHGAIKDVIESFRNLYFNVATKPVRVLHEQWDNYFKNKPSWAQWLQFCHSQGAIHVRLALMDYPEDYRLRMHVVAIAPAGYIPKGLCASIRHYVSERDFVPLFDAKGRLACQDTITVLKPHEDASFHDHAFLSPTYKDVIKKEVNDFINKYGDK